ncbi:polysialyltransferase family glycosyltransferase [Desulfomicrobium norvegicum]|uniref:polysialyltransferase family glycosyltransferase n=1 Tax=Desulfomicrobium norvegicum (strain DSM 1741 / NCIMB 8310) TaxID=52561 RepID=UPI001160AC9D|nr:polysialyltransferase family glycosyltransferase [Desulfomicrobium norvegicum]
MTFEQCFGTNKLLKPLCSDYEGGGILDKGGQSIEKFVACDLISPFHIIAALSAASALCKSSASVQLHMLPNLNKKYAIEKGTFKYRDLSISITHSKIKKFNFKSFIESLIKFIFLLIAKLLFRKNKYCVAHHTYFNFFTLNNLTFREIIQCKTITIEEGIGTYGGLFHHLRAGRREKKHYPVLKYLGRCFFSLPLFVSMNWKILTGENQEHVDAVVIFLAEKFYHKEIIKLRTWITKQQFQKVFILIGSPLVELYGVSSSELLQLLHIILKEVNSRGGTLILKRHPLERNDKLYRKVGIHVIGDEIPGEILIRAIEPDAIIGYNSGLLIIGNAVFGITSYTIHKILPKQIQEKIFPEAWLRRFIERHTTPLSER